MRRDRNGAALVELAMILPVLFLVLVAIMELSRVFMLRHSADTAAYEAARQAMVVGANWDDAEETARQLLTAARINAWTMQTSPERITEKTPKVKVVIRIPAKDNTWISPFFSRNLTIESSVELITERPSNIQLTGLPSHDQLLGINAVGLGL